MKLVDGISLMDEGMGKIVIQKKEGKIAFIEDVLFVIGMQCNLLSIGQLVEKGFLVIMEGGSLKIYDKKKIMVLK